MVFLEIFKSKYCRVVFLLSFFLAYLIVPKTIFYGWHSIIGLLFIFSFAVTLTCIIRTIKERIQVKKAQKGSLLGIIAAAIGIIGIQGCAASIPICGTTIWLAFMSLFLPGTFITFFIKYGTLLVLLSVILQLIALYSMNCFKKTKRKG